MSSSPYRRRAFSALGLAVTLVLALTGWTLLRDEPGLALDFFPLDVDWQGEPLFSDVGVPRLEKAEDLHGNALPVIFSVRWRGWLVIEKGGSYDLSIAVDDAGYLDLDGSRLLDATGPVPGRRTRATTELAAGIHPIEIGYAQAWGRAFLAIEWTPPGGEPDALPAEALFARRPVRLYRLARGARAALPPLAARLSGAMLLLVALLTLMAFWRRGFPVPSLVEPGRRAVAGALDRLPPKVRILVGSRRVRYGAFFLTLFVVTWLTSLPWTAATFAGDDAAYVRASQFEDHSLWYFNRMTHVYLLRLFIGVFGGGDSFFGSRVYGAFILAVTVLALAVAVRHLGPRLQLRTLAVTLFLLFSQATVTGTFGGPFTDYTLMMMLTVALAVFLHGRAREKLRPAHEWHSLALGVLTLACLKSKATGVIVILLAGLLLWAEGRIDWRRFGRRLAYFTAGLAAAQLALMTADLFWRGDFLWSVRPYNLAGMGLQLRPRVGEILRPESGWLDVLWPVGGKGAALALGHLSVLVLATPFVAAIRRQRLERRLLYLFPAAYLLMLIVVYSRLQHPVFSRRMLIPMIPAACFVAGALFYHLGIETFRWRALARPRVLVPLFLAAAAICLVVTPYLAGELTAEELVPVEFAARYGWEPDHFLRATELPAILLGGLLLATLAFHRPRFRLALVMFVTFALLGVAFRQSVSSFEHRYAAQRAELTLYPWRVFREEMEAARPQSIQVSPDVVWQLQMMGRVHNTLAIIFLDRLDIYVFIDRAVPREADLAIATRRVYEAWCRGLPELAETAVFDPAGALVLVRPREAAEAAAARVDAAGRGTAKLEGLAHAS